MVGCADRRQFRTVRGRKLPNRQWTLILEQILILSLLLVTICGVLHTPLTGAETTDVDAAGTVLETTPHLSTELLPPGRTEQVGGRPIWIRDGFQLELAAGAPLVERPICVAQDEAGRLYVAESSGSNDPVERQLAERPHKILRLEDADGDGKFDLRTEFVSRIMFPEGALWYDGSLYVAAPPQIWKFTDNDQDGIAEQQEVWFDGKTLTGCANDLHGPYLGPDGWIYWCKGAFAEQSYEQNDGRTWSTRAAHIFRRRPEGGPIEAVMTGGMDNPVEVAFSRGGERFFTTTFLQHPAGGLRDGIVHAVYGGLYGKDHGVLEGHVRTGPLMPVMVHLGAAAPAGLTRLETLSWGGSWRDCLLACSFNLHQLSAHCLTQDGATYRASQEILVRSDDLDFHPTDVLEDGDGSLLLVNTGGWYKLCCPTSQLWKPDELGAIYRLRHVGDSGRAAVGEDPRGSELSWQQMDVEQLVGRLSDPRLAVWHRAQWALIRMARENSDRAVANIVAAARTSGRSVAERHVWTLCQMQTPKAAAGLVELLWFELGSEGRSTQDRSAGSGLEPDLGQRESVRALVHALGLLRWDAAREPLERLLAVGSPGLQRAACEALGRLGDGRSVNALLDVMRSPMAARDRVLQHSCSYALWEIGDVERLLGAWRSEDLTTAQRYTLLWALEQLPESTRSVPATDADREGGQWSWADVRIHLQGASDGALTDALWWAAQRHEPWHEQIEEWIRGHDARAWREERFRQPAVRYLVATAHRPQVARWLADQLESRAFELTVRQDLLARLSQRRDLADAAIFSPALAALLATPATAASADEALGDLPGVLGVAERLRENGESLGELLQTRLRQWSEDDRVDVTNRIRAQRLAFPRGARPGDSLWQRLFAELDSDAPPSRKMLVLDFLDEVELSAEQERQLASRLAAAGPYELPRLTETVLRKASPRNQLVVIALEALNQNPVAEQLDPRPFQALLSSDDPRASGLFDTLKERWAAALAGRAEQLEERLGRLPEGDVRRGQEVFHSAKAACFSCHAMGYLGGELGPDLTRIGRIRDRRDLLEAIVFPSASWVRSYEPVTAVLIDGRTLSGLLKAETDQELVLAVNATVEHRVPRETIELLQVGGPSVMPEGMGQVLTDQQLADLLTFLSSAK